MLFVINSLLFTSCNDEMDDLIIVKLNPIYIGTSYVTAFHDFFIGYFDELRISNKVRSPEEIKTVFDNKSEFISDVNTIGLWRFENEIKI
jgi:hypothetical protein